MSWTLARPSQICRSSQKHPLSSLCLVPLLRLMEESTVAPVRGRALLLAAPAKTPRGTNLSLCVLHSIPTALMPGCHSSLTLHHRGFGTFQHLWSLRSSAMVPCSMLIILLQQLQEMAPRAGSLFAILHVKNTEEDSRYLAQSCHNRHKILLNDPRFKGKREV